MNKAKVAIIGSGNIGTDLMTKIFRRSEVLEATAMVGIDPASDGLERARSMGVATTASGLDGLLAMPDFETIEIVFDATSAPAHSRHSEVLLAHGKQVIDLTPAAIGPFVVPVVNLDDHLGAPNVNLVTCGGQATIPIVAAIARKALVHYAEIVSSISARSAGPGTRANIDEFTETTTHGLQTVGGAVSAKAIIVLNPAEPPLLMRNTVYCLVGEEADEDAVEESVHAIVADVQNYVPGYRLKQNVQFDRFSSQRPLDAPSIGFKGAGVQVTVLLEVTGSADYLPAYAGNLDIMTSAAQRTAERLVGLRRSVHA